MTRLEQPTTNSGFIGNWLFDHCPHQRVCDRDCDVAIVSSSESCPPSSSSSLGLLPSPSPASGPDSRMSDEEALEDDSHMSDEEALEDDSHMSDEEALEDDAVQDYDFESEECPVERVLMRDSMQYLRDEVWHESGAAGSREAMWALQNRPGRPPTKWSRCVHCQDRFCCWVGGGGCPARADIGTCFARARDAQCRSPIDPSCTRPDLSEDTSCSGAGTGGVATFMGTDNVGGILASLAI